MRDACSGSGWTRPRVSRLRIAYGASAAASRSSRARRDGCTERALSRLAFRFHDDLDCRADVAADQNRHGERPELLDGLLEQDAPPVHGVTLRGEQALDVDVGDGSEEAPPFARPRLHGERQALELRGDALGRLAVALRLDGDDALLVLELGHVLPARLDRETAGEQVVPRIARPDPHDLPDRAQV